MASKFARILLATLVGVALSGITACDQPGPAEQTAAEVEEAAEEAAEAASEAAGQIEEEVKALEEAVKEEVE
jgi:hypothetical protein